MRQRIKQVYRDYAVSPLRVEALLAGAVVCALALFPVITTGLVPYPGGFVLGIGLVVVPLTLLVVALLLHAVSDLLVLVRNGWPESWPRRRTTHRIVRTIETLTALFFIMFTAEAISVLMQPDLPSPAGVGAMLGITAAAIGMCGTVLVHAVGRIVLDA